MIRHELKENVKPVHNMKRRKKFVTGQFGTFDISAERANVYNVHSLMTYQHLNDNDDLMFKDKIYVLPLYF